MAQVPYNPVPQVPTDVGQVREVAVQGVSAAAFGGDVAEGLTSLGKTLDNVGDEWFKRAMALQKLNNESEAREVEASYTIEAGELSAKYNALQGKDAIAGRQPYVESLRQLREDKMGTLSNQESRRNFADSSLGTMSRLTLYSATHAATENRKYVTGAATAAAAAAVNAVGQTPEDEDAVREARAKSAKAVGMAAAVGGWGEEQTQQSMVEQQSAVSLTQLSAIADKDPAKAQGLFEAHRSGMTAGDIAKAETKINSRLMQVGTRQIEDNVNADLRGIQDPRLPEKSIGDRTQEARALAEKQKPGDAEYADMAVNRVTAGYSRRKAEIREANLNNSYTVNDAVIGGHGSLPTNIEELRSISPAISKAYDDLPPDRKRATQKAMVLNAKGDVPETAATIKDYLGVRGLGLSDDNDDREKFLYTDVMSLNIPLKDRKALAMLQQKVKTDGVGDPRVSAAYRQLVDAGIAPTLDKTSKEDVQVFRGALQEALDVWQAENKRRPDLKETKEIGSRLTQTMSDPGRWSFGIGLDQTPVWQFKVPEQFKTLAVGEATKGGMPEPTDEELRRLYVRYRYRQMYDSKPKAQPK